MNDSLDFGSNGNASQWYAVTDRVMGGRSNVGFYQSEKSIILRGEVSLRNNGGFVSCRSRDQRYRLAQYAGVRIRYRSEGQTLAFILHNNTRFYLPKYRISLPETEMEWTEVTYSWSDFNQSIMGKNTGEKLPEKLLDQIIRLSFISTEKKEGLFTFEVDFIEFIQS